MSDGWHVAKKKPLSKYERHALVAHPYGVQACGTAFITSLQSDWVSLRLLQICTDRKTQSPMQLKLSQPFDGLQQWDIVDFQLNGNHAIHMEKVDSMCVYRGVGRVGRLDPLYGKYGFAVVSSLQSAPEFVGTDMFFHRNDLVPPFHDLADALQRGDAIAFEAIDNQLVAPPTQTSGCKLRAVHVTSLVDIDKHLYDENLKLEPEQRSWLETLARLPYVTEAESALLNNGQNVAETCIRDVDNNDQTQSISGDMHTDFFRATPVSRTCTSLEMESRTQSSRDLHQEQCLVDLQRMELSEARSPETTPNDLRVTTDAQMHETSSSTDPPVDNSQDYYSVDPVPIVNEQSSLEGTVFDETVTHQFAEQFATPFRYISDQMHRLEHALVAGESFSATTEELRLTCHGLMGGTEPNCRPCAQHPTRARLHAHADTFCAALDTG